MNPFIVCTLFPDVKLLWLAYREQKGFLVVSKVLWQQRKHDCDSMIDCDCNEWLKYNTFPSSVLFSPHSQHCTRSDLEAITYN